ncbi:DEP domain-containing mTOR-interacting protein-like [Rhincodon typus]|uniref:DEP domain-containing mTOR-interacting protein-like n=1 Tax=Rhincodon typus TaxID=259920 RepID=UPI00202FA4CB|nr:DEP domain-containing mTOR-interacting protein-like [Rhincodon typus]
MESLQNSVKKKATERHYKAEVLITGEQLRLLSSEDAIMKLQEENGLKYQRAVLGCEIIDWLIKEGEASSRKEAVELCRRELEHGIIQHGNISFTSILSRLLNTLHVSIKAHLSLRNSSGYKLSLSNLSPLDNRHIPVSNRHHFFDSNLLYQFRLNFRRRRRLTELLSEDSGTAQESHDSPFCLRKLNPEQDGSSFLSVQTNKEIKVVSAVRRSSITSAVTGSATFYNTAPSLACLPSVECNPKSVISLHETLKQAGITANLFFNVRQFVVSVNSRHVMHLDYKTVSNIIMTGPRTLVMEVMEAIE